MKNSKPLPQRKSPRLQGYDYSQSGAYFVTICTYQRQLLFGTIHDSKMTLDPLGQIVYELWQTIPQHKPTVELDYFIVMPNHFHGILLLNDGSPKLGTIIGHFKAAVTRKAREKLNLIDTIWQTRFHDHIIRNDEKLNYIRQYVVYNPAQWKNDKFYL